MGPRNQVLKRRAFGGAAFFFVRSEQIQIWALRLRFGRSSFKTVHRTVLLRSAQPCLTPRNQAFKASCLRWCGVFGFGAGCSCVCDKNRSSPNATNLSQRYGCPPKVALQLVMRVGDSSRSRPQPPCSIGSDAHKKIQ